MTDINKGEAFGWDEEEVSDEGGRVLLPAGTYQFQVADFQRKRFEGSAKMAACPKAELTLAVITDTGVETVTANLFLNTKQGFKVAQFFESLGYRKNPETGKVPVKWNEVKGATGWLELSVREYQKDGNTYKVNDVAKYLKPSEAPAQQQAPQQAAYQQPVQTAMAVPAQPASYQHPNQGYVM